MTPCSLLNVARVAATAAATHPPRPAGRRRPIRLVEGADRRGDRVRSGAVCDDAAVVLDKAVPYRRQKQADGDEEHQGKSHRASQARARTRSHSAVAVSPRKRAALAWTRR